MGPKTSIELLFFNGSRLEISRKQQLSTIQLGFNRFFWSRSTPFKIGILAFNGLIILWLFNYLLLFALLYGISSIFLIIVSFFSQNLYYDYVIDYKSNYILKKKVHFQKVKANTYLARPIKTSQFSFESFMSKAQERFVFKYNHETFGVVSSDQKERILEFLMDQPQHKKPDDQS